MPTISVNLIGAGRVGKTLLGLLRSLPACKIQDVLSSRYVSAQAAVGFVGDGRAVEHPSDLRPADLWILAVPDTQILAVASEISDVFKQRKHEGSAPIAFHCSGFFAAEQMAPLRGLGWQLASVHPVLSFADPAEAMRQFNGTFCGIEGDRTALDAIEPMLIGIGGVPFEIRSESKSLYHAAAVISNNFTVVLQALARDAWAAAGVPEDIAKQLNSKLLRATCENVTARGPREALTGPAARGDELVVKQQGLDVARWHPSAGIIYREMSALARKMKSECDPRE
ncbi:Rossmann-like and DUF2520 domain-containing protein [Aliiroseovarius sp.]|uniref:Rossmann-like and DUF2520 domain-containing protein n=1 Tax=Aliiroseovarius sp. TaxID=1872442 RepID=UPI00262FAA46|nr:Rossmann-like and DUF2520 domain-containing protein [Aliiroseovarius sp.]